MRRKGTWSFIFLSKRRIYEKDQQQDERKFQEHEQHEKFYEGFGQQELRRQVQRYEGLTVSAKKKLEHGAKMRSDEDALGSYTGVYAEDEWEKPVQDADDL